MKQDELARREMEEAARHQEAASAPRFAVTPATTSSRGPGSAQRPLSGRMPVGTHPGTPAAAQVLAESRTPSQAQPSAPCSGRMHQQAGHTPAGVAHRLGSLGLQAAELQKGSPLQHAGHAATPPTSSSRLEQGGTAMPLSVPRLRRDAGQPSRFASQHTNEPLDASKPNSSNAGYARQEDEDHMPVVVRSPLCERRQAQWDIPASVAGNEQEKPVMLKPAASKGGPISPVKRVPLTRATRSNLRKAASKRKAGS